MADCLCLMKEKVSVFALEILMQRGALLLLTVHVLWKKKKVHSHWKHWYRGAHCYGWLSVSYERKGKCIRIGNTDAEGCIAMADCLCLMKENSSVFALETLMQRDVWLYGWLSVSHERKGKHIHIGNTDAEGYMAMADCICVLWNKRVLHWNLFALLIKNA